MADLNIVQKMADWSIKKKMADWIFVKQKMADWPRVLVGRVKIKVNCNTRGIGERGRFLTIDSFSGYKKNKIFSFKQKI